MSEQHPYSKQLLDLAGKISKDNYNITAFKRRKSLETKSTRKLLEPNLRTQPSKSQSKNSNHTILKQKPQDKPNNVVERYTMQVGARKRKKSHVTDYNQTGYTQHFVTRRNNNNPRENVKNQDRSDVSGITLINKDKIVSSQRALTTDMSVEKQRIMIKKTSNLNDAHLENWINQCLIERCPDQKYDKSIINPAIKRFQVDKNSLLSYGVSQTNISRILKCLYVYSNGFNNLLNELGNHSIPLKKNLWRVFSLLVEHCSQGTIETVVSLIYKQSQKEQEGLKKEIEKQQEIISNNQSLNRELNEKIFRENNELRQMNDLLELDRAVLKQNSEEHERAFAQQVSLRLMFESKISDLHRLYRELQIKHHKLFSDFQVKLNEITYFKDKATYYHEENVKLRKDKGGLQNDLCQKTHQVKRLKEVVGKLKQELNEYFIGEVQRKIDKKMSDNVIRQRQIKETQLQGRLKTVQASLQISQRTHQSCKEEYHRSLDQNRRLISKLDNEMAEITAKLRQHKENNNNNAHFLSEINSLSLKIQQKMRVLAEMEVIARLNFQKIDELSLELEVSRIQAQSFQADLAAGRQTIVNLKRVNNQLQDILAQSQRSNQNLQRNAKQLCRKLQLEQDNCKHWKKKYESAQFQLQKTITQSKILKEEIPKLEKKVQKSVAVNESNVRVQKQRMMNMEVELNKNRILAQKAREAYNMVQQKLRDEKFQRGNLDYKYKHSLTVIENLQDVVKNQNSKMSELQRNTEELTLGIKLGKKQYARLQDKATMEIQNLQQKITRLEGKIKQKHGYSHPMVVEDLLQNLQRMQEKYDQLMQTLSIWKDQYQQKKFSYQQRINRMEERQRTGQSQLLEQLHRMSLQIEYQQSKQKDYTQKIEYLQLTLNAKARFEQSEPLSQSYKEKEKRYLQIISENYFKINSLVADMEALEDHNQDLIARVQSTEKELTKRQELLSSVQRQKDELREVNQELAEEQNKFEAVRKQLQQEINDRQSLLSSYVPEYKSLRQSPSQKLKKGRQLSPRRKADNNSANKRKISLMEPIIAQIKERDEEGREAREGREADRIELVRADVSKWKKKGSQKSSYDNQEWRADFSSKLRSSFGYYN